ncbi:protocatechuate 3,4-dioxygenase subunit beta [Rhodococcus sp. Z13]|uniref:Protocatechuate 3,4-dioxygenase subunit beta n=1 Tax=Rhodococcus sacchari TaxID=2962047 RepID=A0ACD4DCZ8_9NOCA|nr:protocatechuate 3,4-dioxygenase subunit beta [Rhodococcus sp. Z13]UYP17916.1 protocatechuate 3,4-dioxygenase subunit beta [Rhodococcus sp. Z13]
MIETFDPPLADSNSAISRLRVPLEKSIHLDKDFFHNRPGPAFGQLKLGPFDNDLTVQAAAEPIGTRVIVHGNITDSAGVPVKHALVEIWQANSAGGYRDSLDVSGFPLDPNFYGAGRCLTDARGYYRFTTIRPGPYPAMFKDGARVWRASHIHFSVLGAGCSSRLITQMYFEGDPLIRMDRMINAIPDRRGQERLIAKLEPENSISESFGPSRTLPTVDGSGAVIYPPKRTDPGAQLTKNPSALCYRFDVVLRGSAQTPFE